ncbi:hypothetical protein FS749_005270 [Ceratobasidium sp. UAMH 11750]|nr:hypothetical protein FS749_005270 [Ceratobasidium sp. UAMH 11750]
MLHNDVPARGVRARGRRDERQSPEGDQSDQEPRDREDEELEEPPEDASPEELREALREAQLARQEHRQAAIEKDREISKLQEQVGRKRARAERFKEKTPHDSKYADAGKRCALMRMIWIPTGMYDLEPNPAYLPELRYEKAHPEMRLQGEQADILSSMALRFREDFLKLELFQYKFDHAHGEQRRNSASRVRKCASLIFGCEQRKISCSSEDRASNQLFKELLGFTAEGTKPSERYPCMAPMLYKDLQGGANSNPRVFRHEFIFKTFSAILFGSGSLHQPRINPPQGQPVIAKILGIRTITPGAIAVAAILARWCISPDETFTEEGDKTGITWFEDYQSYKKLIISGISKEEGCVGRGGARGPFLKLMSEWNQRFFPNLGEARGNGGGDGDSSDDPPDVARALEEIDQFVEQEEDGGD